MEFLCHGSGRFCASGTCFTNYFGAYSLTAMNNTSVGLPEDEASTHMEKTY